MPAHAQDNSLISSLVLVAGPSGAGKSTLMDQISAGTLSPGLASALPPGAKAWPHTDCKAYLRKKPPTHGLTGVPKTLDGLVCHYDIMRPISMSFGSFAADPGLSILNAAKDVVIVSILPPPERVAAQFKARAETMLAERQADRLRQLRYRLTGRKDVAIKAPQKKLLDLYNTPGWLDGWYEDWLSYVGQQCRDPSVRALSVDFALEGEGAAMVRKDSAKS